MNIHYKFVEKLTHGAPAAVDCL